MKNYGIQLYSLRDVAENDFEGTLKKVAEMGYKMVESAGFFGHSAEQVKAMLDKYGLQICSTHTGINLLEDNFDATIEYHKTLGCENLIIPWAPFNTKAELNALIDKLNVWIPKAKAQGITMHYHNHHAEFLPNEDGQIAIEELAKRTEIGLEIDTYWAYVAGENPLEVLEKYNDRIKFIHLKDGTKDKQGKSLGQGTAPALAVLKKAEEMGKIIVVESEGLDPTGIEEVSRCMDFLKANQ